MSPALHSYHPFASYSHHPSCSLPSFLPLPSIQKREEAAPVNPLLLGFFIFVVVGSAVFQIIATASKGAI